MFFKVITAMAEKRWKSATETPIPFTQTPLPNLRQRSAVEIGPVPMILAQGAGSLIKSIPNRNTITAISTIRLSTGRFPQGITFYRAYLSQGQGAFIHLAVSDSDPKKILECRIYQPYHEIIPLWKDDDQAKSMNQTYDLELTWSFWLLDDPDPNIGGIIGCPVIVGKNDDKDENGNCWQYVRSWIPGTNRIVPINVIENFMDANGDVSSYSHDMMSYSRMLKDEKTLEYILLSATAIDGGAGVNYWIGIDVDVNDLTIYDPVG